MRTKLSTLLAATAGLAAASLLTAGPAAAAHGAKPSGGSSSIQLVVASGSDSVPNWGEAVTFTVSTTATSQPHVDLLCSQAGKTVYSATTGYYASYPWPWTQTMTLSSQLWTGGAASCTASLYMFTSKGAKNVLAALSFPVYA